MNIALPEVVPDARRNLDARELLETVRVFFARRIVEHEEGVEDLVALDPYNDPDTKRAELEKVRYELRDGQVYFSENGLVGRCTARQFMGIVHYSYDHQLKTLQLEQPGCQWALVAVKVRRQDLMATAEVPYDGDSYSMEEPSKFVKSRESVAIEQRITHAQVPEYRCVVELVFADLARGELADPALYHPAGKEGPMSMYARTRLLRHLTESQRKTRKALVERLRVFYAEQQEARFVLEEENARRRDHVDEMSALRARIAELERGQPRPDPAPKPRKPKAAETTTPPPPSDEPPEAVVVVPDVRPSYEALADRIVEMRTSGQMTPRKIAEVLGNGMTEADVKVTLKQRLP